MTITPLPVQYVVDRATSMSPENRGLTTDPTEMLSVVRAAQRSIYATAAKENRDYFATSVPLTSSAASAGRVVVLPDDCGRILQITITATQQPLSFVDVTDPLGELAPRAYIFGQSVVEVSNDWSASPGVVPLTLYYVREPVDLDPYGTLAQTLSLPQKWIHLLTYNLATYLAHKDPGRDPQEVQRCDQMESAAVQDFIGFYHGTGRRQEYAVPTTGANQRQW